jgi:hypothetical protein
LTTARITVLTTPARPQYLAGTLEAIDAAGGASFAGLRTVYVDGPADDVRAPPGWGVVSLTAGGPSCGTRLSLWGILHRAALGEAPYLLYFEDDVRAARNGITRMCSYEVPPKFGFLTFFQQNPNMNPAPGIHPLPYGRPYWGCQALKIPGRSLARFADRATVPPTWKTKHSCDIWLGEQLKAGVVLPSIVRHVGEVSTIPSQGRIGLTGQDAHRAGLGYAGDDFDALDLP